MVSTRSARRKNEEKHDVRKDNGGVKESERGKGSSSKSSSVADAGVAACDYEGRRAQRMKENMERMKKLGILDLSTQLKQERVSHKKRPAPVSTLPAFSDPPRRSSRLKTKDPITYSELKTPKEEKVEKDVVISIQEGSKPEVYTEEHEKLLGDSKTAWALHVDGFDEEGGRIYDTFLGKSCHQCSYGENVIEVNENPDWICPVCRGICNCNRCRRKNGWAPTGLIYQKVKSLGFKSVAHFLIQTFRSGSKSEEPARKSTDSANASLSNADENNESEHCNSDSLCDIMIEAISK